MISLASMAAAVQQPKAKVKAATLPGQAAPKAAQMPAPAPRPVAPAPAPVAQSQYNPFQYYDQTTGTAGTIGGGGLKTDASGNLPTYYAPPSSAPAYSTATGTTTQSAGPDPKLGQVDNAKVLTSGGAKLDNPYELDMSTNGLGTALATGAAQLDPKDISDPDRRNAILTALGATERETHDIGYDTAPMYDDELIQVAGTPQYTKAALVKILDNKGRKATGFGGTTFFWDGTAGQYYWHAKLDSARLKASTPTLPPLPAPAPLPTLKPTPLTVAPRSGANTALVAVGAALGIYLISKAV